MDRIYVMQLVQSFQSGELSRRDFLKRAGAIVGSVAAAQLLAACGPEPATMPVPPVVDNTPQDDDMADDAAGAMGSERILTDSITYPDEDGSDLMGYLARPSENTGRSAIIVIQEWWGLNAHIRDVTRRFAREGFVALAPDLYNGVVTTEPDEARKLVMELDMVNAVREIGQAMTYLLEQEYVAGPQAGVVGFCMGGGLALQAARVHADILGAAVAFYGRPLEPAQAGDVLAPVLGLYAAEDQGIPVDAVRAMETAFAENEIPHRIKIYPGAQHAFFNDTRASSYDAAAADDAWMLTLDWFRNNL